MALYRLTSTNISLLDPTTFAAANVRERQDLQRLLRANINVVAPGVLVLAEEFADWEDSRRRIDLLALDRAANLVVIELKRDEDAHMELQAVRYAAMVQSMTFERAVEAYASLNNQLNDVTAARTAILDFLQWSEPDEDRFAQDVRIVLVAGDFSKELTTAAIWLNDRDLDVRCVRMKPYAIDGDLVLDVQQIVPLPEAEAYTVQLRRKEQAERTERVERHLLRREFWEGIVAIAKAQSSRFASTSPSDDHWLETSADISGVKYHYLAWGDHCGVRLYIDRKDSAFNRRLFESLEQSRHLIEERYGKALEWNVKDDRRACYITDDSLEGGIRSPRSEWPAIQDRLTKAMQRFELAIAGVLKSSAGNLS